MAALPPGSCVLVFFVVVADQICVLEAEEFFCSALEMTDYFI